LSPWYSEDTQSFFEIRIKKEGSTRQGELFLCRITNKKKTRASPLGRKVKKGKGPNKPPNPVSQYQQANKNKRVQGNLSSNWKYRGRGRAKMQLTLNRDGRQVI